MTLSGSLVPWTLITVFVCISLYCFFAIALCSSSITVHAIATVLLMLESVFVTTHLHLIFVWSSAIESLTVFDVLSTVYYCPVLFHSAQFVDNNSFIYSLSSANTACISCKQSAKQPIINQYRLTYLSVSERDRRQKKRGVIRDSCQTRRCITTKVL